MSFLKMAMIAAVAALLLSGCASQGDGDGGLDADASAPTSCKPNSPEGMYRDNTGVEHPCF